MDPSAGLSFSGTWERILLKEIISELDQESMNCIDKHPEILSEAIIQAAPKSAKIIYDNLRRNAPDITSYERERRLSFGEDNYQTWKKTL